MSAFVKHNQNPQGWKRSDCVIRALSFALDISFYQVLQDLYTIGVRLATIQNDNRVYVSYLERDHGLHKMSVKKEVDGDTRRFTVGDICAWKGTYIVQVASHLTVVKDGACYDTWDCRKKSAYRIWKVK
jgi:hypothetical protein